MDSLRDTSCDSRDELASTGSSSSSSLATDAMTAASAVTVQPAASGSSDSRGGGSAYSRRRTGQRTLGLRTGAMRWRRCILPVSHRTGATKIIGRSSGSGHSSASGSGSGSGGSSGSGSGGSSVSGSGSGTSPGAGTASQSNNQLMATSLSSLSDDRLLDVSSPQSKDAATPNSNASADFNHEGSSVDSTETAGNAEGPNKPQQQSSSDDSPFANLESRDSGSKIAGEPDSVPKADLANLIEKAILDFCSSRTVETMRRMFAGVTSEMEALQGEAARNGDKSVQAPHPVTADLVKEGIVIGKIDVFAPRVHREYCLVMKDCLVEGFLRDTGVFRSICYRTKCQLEITRRLLNRKLCTGGRWVKYLIVRIVGPSLRAITCCDQLLQKAVPSFKQRIEYTKPAYCRLFFREDIPDNTLLYNCYQRTGGTSNRYGALRLDTPYRLTTERTVGNCPWKSGALKIGKLSFSGSGGHMSMQQVYPGYGYTTATPVEPDCRGVEAIQRIEQMHGQFLARRQVLLQDRRVMTIPVCR